MRNQLSILRIELIIIIIVMLVSLTACNSESKKALAAPVSDTSTTEQKNTIVLVTGEWPPYSSDAIEGKGFASQIISAILDEMGVSYQIEFYPWIRGQQMVLNNEVWACFPYYSTVEREQRFNYSDPFVISTVKYYYYDDGKIKGNINFKNLAELKPYTFGRIAGYFYESKFDEFGMKTETGNSTDNLITMLRSGRIDIMVEDELVAQTEIKKLYPEEMAKFKTFDQVWGNDPMFMMTSKNYRDGDQLMKQFNAALITIKKNGVYQKIMDKYGISQTKTQQ